MLTETALLFFTRSAASEAANKTFVAQANNKINRKVASSLIKNTRNIATSSGLPVFEINEQQQVGSSFGERLGNAMEAVFNEGFENVIVIGNDCPQLTSTIINKAQLQLNKHALVLGPDHHGGVYLAGINKSVFNKNIFSKLQWQTADLLKDIKAEYCDVVAYELPPFTDVNNFADLKFVTNILPAAHTIKVLVISMLASLLKKYFHLHLVYSNFFFTLFGLRAPPVF